MMSDPPYRRWRSIAREALLDALAVVAPTTCSGCGVPDRAVCDACRRALRPLPQRVTSDEARGLPVYFGFDYDGVARRAIVAFKDGGRTDAARPLASALRTVVDTAIRELGSSGTELVTIPSSRAAFRARGYRPVDLVISRARLRSARVLRRSRTSVDQAGLGIHDRERNRDHSLRAVPAAAGRTFVIVDDIMTTGATIREARRALTEAGANVVGAAVLAYTRRYTDNPIVPEKPEQVEW